jgi:hypothetical protein
LQAPQACIIWVVLEQIFSFLGESLALGDPQKGLNVTHTKDFREKMHQSCKISRNFFSETAIFRL